MIRSLAVGCVLATLAATTASAQLLPSTSIGVRQGQIYDPSSPRYQPLVPSQTNRVTQLSPFPSSNRQSANHQPACPFHGSGGSGFGRSGFGGGYPLVIFPGYWPSAYVYNSYYDGGYYDGGLYGPGYVPVRYMPAEALYGPQAARRFIGEDGARTNNVIIARREADGEPQRKGVRVTNEQTKARAGKFIKIGDQQFARQKYHAAHERYRTAGETAGDLADAFLRQGFALVAMSQYESAGRAFRRGLRIRADWQDADFRLDDLYGLDQVAKVAHLESLAQAAEQNPHDANLMLILGLALWFDGQTERAAPFFERCDQLGGNSEHLLDAFLGADRAALQPNRAPARVEF